MNYKQLQKLNEIIENLKALPNSDENIQFVLDLADKTVKIETLENLIQNGNTTAMPSKPQQDEQANFGLKFTNEEIRQMPKTFKKEFRIDGCSCKLRLRQSGKQTQTYELRYRRNGYNISACGKTKDEVKENFIKKLKTAKPTRQAVSTTLDFCAFTEYYFSNYRIKKVTETTFKNDIRRYNKYLKPYFQGKRIDKITPDECQRLIDSIANEGKGKTSDEIYSLINCIMKMAIAHHLIQHNPMDIVLHIQHETEHGSALTTEETAILFQAIKGQSYERIIALAYYTGLRPNEYETAKIDGDFIVAINSKRKNKKIQYKRIPICNALRPYLDGITEIKLPIALKTIWKKFKIILPNHTLYDLRTTFYTRCKEKGVAEPALMEFVGHSMGALGNAYTDLSNEYLLREGEKLNH